MIEVREPTQTLFPDFLEHKTVRREPSRRPAVLLLGGTGEAAALALRLAGREDLRLISSLAGRVAQPRLPAGEFRIGGFGGVNGLANYLLKEEVRLVVDATHPFAAKMSRNAAIACSRLHLPLISFVRPPWAPVGGDQWRSVPDVEAAAEICKQYRRVFLAIGRQELAPFLGCAEPWFLIRAIDAPGAGLPLKSEVILDRGPFSLKDELQLLRDHAIDCIVAKNSGGQATYAKLEAARMLGLPVLMADRPEPPLRSIGTLEEVLAEIDLKLSADRRKVLV